VYGITKFREPGKLVNFDTIKQNVFTLWIDSNSFNLNNIEKKTVLFYVCFVYVFGCDTWSVSKWLVKNTNL